MSVTINASTSSGLVQTADTSGTVEIQSNGSTKLTVASTGAYGQLIRGTAQTASGSSVDFTGIPSWVKRITVMFDGVSTNGTNLPSIRIGDSGGLESTGYFSQAGNISGTNTTQLTTATAGWQIPSGNAANTFSGVYTIVNITGNTWVISGTGTGNTGNISYIAGNKTLSDTLDRVAFVTVDTFDAGTINILFEG